MQTLENQIESLIDGHGLYAVVSAIEAICYGKSEHLAVNWQDHGAAVRWEKAGVAVDRLSAKLHKIQVEA